MDMRDRGDSDYLFTWYVGLMCARCALAEIVAVSALLIHELGHVFGNSYHCRDNSDEALGGFLAGLWVALSFGTGPGAIVIPLIGAWIGSKLWGDGSKKDCCQYVIEFAFWARLTGRFGLPAIPHLVNLSGNDIATDRFAAGGAVFSVSFGMGAGCEESGASLAYWELTSILVPDAPVNFTWGVRSKCDSTGLSSPATVVL